MKTPQKCGANFIFYCFSIISPKKRFLKIF